MRRLVLPELLDDLPADDPRAVRSRRDLQRLNRRMHSARIITSALVGAFPGSPPGRILEIGAGDGSLLLEVARLAGPKWQGASAELLDQQDLLSPALIRQFDELQWQARSVRADIFGWASRTEVATYDVILANLFLHHFEEDRLKELFASIARRTRVFLALEPRRSAFFMIVARLLWLMGCNRVTRHDAQVSVHAGFRGRELSPLWPSDSGWKLQEREAGVFSHLFLAHREAGQGRHPCHEHT